MAAGEQIAGLLADLQTITETARAGVISKRDEVLEPGETRPAAILFVDIVGFTPLARKLSSEVLTKVVDRTFRIFELTVRAHGGYCDKVIGDAALYVFASHPNYPPVCEAALKAALKLQDRLGQVNESLGETEVRLAIRQGVAFGEVTRQAVGAEQAQLTVIGDSVNQAQRLQATAQPDTIQTTIRVLEKAGDAFTREKLGRLELKGIGEVTAYRVTGVEEQQVQLRGAFQHLSPLTGREAELEQAVAQTKAWLETCYPPESWDITQTSTPLKGRNRLLLLRGVPAVGKSRLAYEIAERVKPELGAVVATAHCAENAILAQFTAELARVAGLTAGNLPQRWEELCANAVRAVSPKYAERQRGHLRLLAYVLDCMAVGASAISQADPKSFAISCQLAIRACCELMAHEGKPVLLIVEDLQWLGGLKDVLADVLARACLPLPLVIIGTARPEYVHEPGGLEEGESCVIELGALSREQGDALVQALLPGLQLPGGIAGELHEKAAGIPYFYEDFVRMLVRRGLVEEQEGHWQPARELVALDIPDDLQTLMLGRLDQLDAEVRELARRASVLGCSFERDLLAAIEQRLGYDHAGHPEDDLRVLLNERLLAVEPGDRYFFEHVLLRQAAYGSLLRSNRRVLHSIAADILSSLHVPGAAEELELLEWIVTHMLGAGRYLEAHEKSCLLLRRVGVYGRDSECDRERLRAESAWREARRENPALPMESAAMLLARMRLAYRRSSLDDIQALCGHALSAGQQTGDLRLQAASYDWLGAVAQDCDDFIQARQYFSLSGELANQASWLEGEICSMCNLAWLHVYDGDYHSAISEYLTALLLAKEQSNDYQVLEVLESLTNVCTTAGWFDQARTFASEALSSATRIGAMYDISIIHCNLATSCEKQGDLDAAVDHELESISMLYLLGDLIAEARERAFLASLYIRKGMLRDAERELALAEAQVSQIGNLEGIADVRLSQCKLRVELGDLAAACDKLRGVREIQARLSLGLRSPLGVEITKARSAVIDFAREHGLEADVADLVADHEREQAELALLRAERQGARPG